MQKNLYAPQLEKMGPARKWRREMGEVRVRVRMSNYIDLYSYTEGRLRADQVRTIETEALVDAGVTLACLPAALAEQLGLPMTNLEPVTYADGRRGRVPLIAPVHIWLENRFAIQEVAVLGDETLIGQLVLQKTDLWVDCSNHRLVPNPSSLDGPLWMAK